MIQLPNWPGGIPPITQWFHQVPGEYGNDFATPVGYPIYAPFAGVFSSEDKGKKNWGKRAFVTAGNGVKFAVGHLTQFAHKAGDYVQQGQLIGYSGGAPSDPSSGNTSGPHVEVQFLDAFGHYLDPQSIFKKFPDWEHAIFHPGQGLVIPTPEQLAAKLGVNAAHPTLVAFASNPISDAVKQLVPNYDPLSFAWLYRVLFVGIGVVMIGAGLLIYFKGDDIKNFTVSTAKTAATAAPEALAA